MNDRSSARAAAALGGVTSKRPRVTRVALVLNAGFPAAEVHIGSIEMAAAALAVNAIRIPGGGVTEIEREIATFAAEPNLRGSFGRPVDFAVPGRGRAACPHIGSRTALGVFAPRPWNYP
jgi:hypothetical protein